MRLFSLEGGLMRSISKFTDCICLSLVFLLCCIPIFTIGTAMSSLYYAVYKVVRHDRGYVFQEYVSAFRDNFKQTVPVWLLVMAVGACLGADMYVVWNYTAPESPFRLLSYLILMGFLVLYAWVAYLFPYMSRFENTRKDCMKNAILMAAAHLPTTIVVLAVAAASLFWAYLVFPCIIMLPAVCCWIQSFLLERVFRRYMSEEDRAAEDERNRVY
ncbi:MAG: DUF624 domain-containing protein [Lachnospiraceae bacterium]|jgi:uncharacterized membrane protein YesL|nr:DUF624 domain-containing protein [Lachnospiraceae bacterium]